MGPRRMSNTIVADIRENYSAAWAFAFACPILFLIPAAIEFAQHVAEFHIGFYVSRANAHAVAADPVRMGWGYAKALSSILPSYWFTRYLVFGRDAGRARKLEWPAAGLWAVLLMVTALQLYLSLFGPDFGALLGLKDKFAKLASGGLQLLLQIAAIYLTAWMVAWPAGNAAIGPLRSIRIMAGHFWRTILYVLAGMAPLMVVHYALGYGAMGRPEGLVWLMLAIDALVVGFLALTLTGSLATAAMRAAASKGVTLTP